MVQRPRGHNCLLITTIIQTPFPYTGIPKDMKETTVVIHAQGPPSWYHETIPPDAVVVSPTYGPMYSHHTVISWPCSGVVFPQSRPGLIVYTILP